MNAASALALTVAVEFPLYMAGLLALRLTTPWRAALLGVGANLLTQPALWWALYPGPTATAVALGEVCVVLVEGAAVWLVARRDLLLCLVVSLGANAASFGVGLLVSARGAG